MTYLVENPSTTFYSYTDTGVDPLKIAHGVYITVHGHFLPTTARKSLSRQN